MSYPNSIVSYTTKVDVNQQVLAEGHTIPSGSPYTVTLDHVPKLENPSTVTIPGFGEVTTTPGLNEFQVNYASGVIYFNSGNAGQAITVTYKCVGDDVIASHVNTLQDEDVTIETVIGLNPQGTKTDLVQRLAVLINDDGTLKETGLATAEIPPTKIDSDLVEAQTFDASVVTLVNNMNRIRYQLFTIIGLVNWYDAPSRSIKAINDEIVAARGSMADLDTRLDVSLNNDGTYKTTVFDPRYSIGSGGGASATDNKYILAGTGASQGASLVGVKDDGLYLDGATVEAALQEMEARLDGLRVVQQTSPGATVRVYAGHLVKSDGLGTVTYAGGNSPSFNTTPSTRVDLVTINDSGTIAIVQGTDGSSTPPDYPQNVAVLAEVTIPSGAGPAIAQANIKDVRDIIGGGASQKAVAVSIADSGDFFDGTNVETALQQLGTDTELLRVVAYPSPNNTVRVYPGHFVKSDGTGTVTYAGGSSTVYTPVTTNPRIDLLTIDDTGTIGRVEGTEAPSPVPPAYPANKQVLAEITITETGTVQIVAADIKDVRGLLGGGGGSQAEAITIDDAGNWYETDNVEAALQTIAANVNLLKPQPQAVPDNTVYVHPGHFVKSNGQSTVTFAGGNSPTFPVVTADSRIDLLCIDDTGTLNIVAGVQAAVPVPPTYPSTQQVIAEITITETTTVVINAGDIKDCRYFLNLGGGGAVAYRNKFIVGTASGSYTGSLTVFDLDYSYAQDGKSLYVYVDGTLMAPGGSDDYLESLPTRVTFNYALVAGQEIELRTVVSAAPATQFYEYRENYVVGTASGNYTGSLTVFDTVQAFIAGGTNLLVYLDGVLMTLGGSNDYTETSSTQITFVRSPGLVAGQKVSFVFKRAAAAYDAQSVNGIQAAVSPTANKLVPLDSNLDLPFSTLRNAIGVKNLIPNDGFEFWGRGTSFSTPAHLALICDDWQVEYNGSPTFVVSRETGAGNFDTGVSSAKLNVSAMGGATYVQLAFSVPNYQQFFGKKISASVRVKANVAADIWITDGVAGSGSSAHTGDNTWQTLTVTDTIATNATKIELWLRVQAVGIAYFDSVMMVVGDRAVNYVPYSYASNVAQKFPVKLFVSTSVASRVAWNASEVTVYDYVGNPLTFRGTLSSDVYVSNSGVDGLDTGSEAANTWYYLWLISNGLQLSGLLSVSKTAPTMPTGYTHKRLVGAYRNNASSDFVNGYQADKYWEYHPTTPQVYSESTNAGVNTSRDLSAIVPSIARLACLNGVMSSTYSVASMAYVSMRAGVYNGGAGNLSHAFFDHQFYQNGGIIQAAGEVWAQIDSIQSLFTYHASLGANRTSYSASMSCSGFIITEI